MRSLVQVSDSGPLGPLVICEQMNLLNDEFEYKQFVTVLTYCFVFRQGLSIPLPLCQTRNNILK